MNIQQGVPLSDYSTMRLGGVAAYLTEVSSRNEVAEAAEYARKNNLPAIMIGGGSNIVWSDKGWPGLVIVNVIPGFESFKEDEDNVYITIGSGENWDSVVARTVEQGLHGIEALSLIPGTAGATPVQNVGAYGQEISETLVSVEAYDNQTKSFINIANSDCGFAYRTSRFKEADKGRFFITGLTIHLMRSNPAPPFYPALQAYFEQNTITSYSPEVVRNAVIAIRSSKLPDPAVTPTNGSFFTNPIVSSVEFRELQDANRDLVFWEMEDGKVKLSAAWLMEKAGFKGYHDQETGMATSDKQALVVINEHAKSTADLLKFKQKIVDKVQTMFGITLAQEPELIGQ